MQIEQSIPLETINELNNIFIDKNWNLGIDNEDNAFNLFCEMLLNFNKKQQRLILELTRKYLRISCAEIPQYLRLTLENIPEQSDDIKKIFVLPLLTKDDRDKGKSKSSQFIYYLLQSWETSISNIINVNSVVFGTYEWLTKILNDNDWKLLLVDDFIGTGGTAETAIIDLVQETGIDRERIIVFAIVSQDEGYQKLISQGITVVCTEKRKKGISDGYVESIRDDYIEIMESIENKIKIKNGFHFGYNRSEALVTLTRTPNNTFPVFWEDKKINNDKWPAPFPRQK